MLTAAGGAQGQGTPAPAPPPADPAPPADARTYELSEVEELPRPLNVSEISRLLMASYPPSLIEAQDSGSVMARFRVLEDGSVDSTSITITESDNELFNAPTIRAFLRFRFRPARIHGQPVKVWIDQPLAWVPPAAEGPRSQAAQPGAAAGAASAPPDVETYSLAEVDELPRAANGPEFVRAIRARYPRELQREGVTATVVARFRVLEDGRIDPESISITRTENERFNEPTLQVLRILRFQPARVSGQPVKVWVDQPVAWAPPQE
ncbi:MAG TPA: energy transducer TonB [Longimicrobium sp.]|nr:energy transducer TonB [Longimicrobium sp.]